jgi:hypothetical protein
MIDPATRDLSPRSSVVEQPFRDVRQMAVRFRPGVYGFIFGLFRTTIMRVTRGE